MWSCEPQPQARRVYERGRASRSRRRGESMNLDVIVSLCKRRGFIFQSSEIYGGIASCWDYGPLGVELKNNVKRAWWRDNVYLRPDVVGLDAAILMHPSVWKASGHLDHFTDPMVDCRACRRRFRADKLDETPWVHYCPATRGNKFDIPAGEPCKHCGVRRTLCPACGKGDLTPPRQFNLMFRTFMGPVEEDASVTYLRPETAQGIFVNFDNVLQATRRKLPFGIAQIGKAFRNEITPGNFIFRSREFEQMEMQYFARPADAMRRHAEFSGKDLRYFDEATNEKFIPHVVETSVGADRATYAILCAAYDEEPDKEGIRVLLRFKPHLAPYKVAVLPLSKKPELSALARDVWADVRPHFVSTYDETQAIGRRYRRQDEIGTPLCVTIDFESLEDRQVTIRERDSMGEIRGPIAELVPALREKLGA